MGPILKYKLPLDTIKSEIVVYEIDGQGEKVVDIDPAAYDINKNQENESIFEIVDLRQYTDGRTLRVEYVDQIPIVHGFRLSFEPIADSLKISWNGERCENKKEEVLAVDELDPSVVRAYCPSLEPSDKEFDVKIVYRYKGDKNMFQIPDINPDEDGLWEVYIDEVKTGDFSRDGNIIILNNKLKDGAKVKIRYTPPS